ncbi:MAG: ribosomal-processing cysteine protease Prp [Sphaerochaetaceae bacterium]
MTQTNFSALQIKGHTKTSVCNAISALAWTLAGTLANLIPGECNLNENDDHMFISVQTTSQAHVNLVFETIYVGLQQLQKQHPDEIMDIEFMIPPMDEEEGTDE